MSENTSGDDLNELRDDQRQKLESLPDGVFPDEKMPGMIRMHSDVFVDMQEDVRMLRALEAAGVDNWEGYDHARQIYCDED